MSFSFIRLEPAKETFFVNDATQLIIASYFEMKKAHYRSSQDTEGEYSSMALDDLKVE